jgi:shikimate kinase
MAERKRREKPEILKESPRTDHRYILTQRQLLIQKLAKLQWDAQRNTLTDQQVEQILINLSTV